MPTDAGWPGIPRRSLLATAAAEIGIAAPWLLCIWLNDAIACHRWAGGRLLLSLVASTLSAAVGWCLVRRAADRYDDARLGDLLARVEDAPAWELFSHPAQVIKCRHLAWCRRRWGITPRTSGWQHFRLSWRNRAARALACFALTAHALWASP